MSGEGASSWVPSCLRRKLALTMPYRLSRLTNVHGHGVGAHYEGAGRQPTGQRSLSNQRITVQRYAVRTQGVRHIINIMAVAGEDRYSYLL